VSWKSQKQTSVALSSNEAEYMAASESAREACWIRNLVRDMGFLGNEIGPINFRIDNKGVEEMTKNPITTNRSKHIDVRFHYTKDLILNGTIQIQRIASQEMVADGLTKPLRTDKFVEFRVCAISNLRKFT